MSLKVWLPLNGDLENKGCDGEVMTSLGTDNAFTTGGKIGTNCAHLTKISGNISIPSMAGAKQMSFAYWVKVNNAWSTNWLDGIRWYSTNGSSDATSRQEFYTNCTQIGVWFAGDPNSISGKAFTVGVWHHLAFTIDYNSGNANFYIDGTSVGTATGVNTGHYLKNGIFTIGDNGVDISMNDVRIYDHALSAAEVKEISQALVLHYKLNDAVGFTDIIQNQNTYAVYNNYSGSGTTGTLTNLNETFDGNVVRREVMTPNDTSVGNFRTSLGSHGVYGHRQTFLANTKYVFWIYYRPISHMDIRVGGTASNIGGWTEIPPIAIGNGWYRVGQYRNGSVAEDKTDNIFTSFYTPSAASGVPITIDWASPHLLAGTTEIPPYNYPSNIIQDSSGYGHNGNINGNPTASSDTFHYTSSIFFNGVNDCISIPYNAVCPHNNFTCNLWFKKDDWGTKGYETLFGGPSGFEMDTRSGTNQALQLNMVSTRSGKRNLVTEMSLGNWYMITMTRSDTIEKYYVNGIYQSEIEAKAMPTGNYFIGSWSSTTSQNYYGYISDFRLYNTVLSDEDILKLYNTSMSIDNLSNAHPFEINESNTNKLTKSGILFDQIVEPYLTLSDGSKWKLMLCHYVDNGRRLFTSSNATYCNELGLYSRLNEITNYSYDNKYEYYVIQDGKEFRWTQTSSPTATSISGLTTVSGYLNPVNGLAKPTSLTQTYIGYNSWWGACGCWTSYSTGGKTGIPGFGSHDANGICENYLALYTRISDTQFKLKDELVEAAEFIER